jgi:hypothetical protein
LPLARSVSKEQERIASHSTAADKTTTAADKTARASQAAAEC